MAYKRNNNYCDFLASTTTTQDQQNIEEQNRYRFRASIRYDAIVFDILADVFKYSRRNRFNPEEQPNATATTTAAALSNKNI